MATAPMLYVGDDKASEEARTMLRTAGLFFEEKKVPTYDSIAVVHGTPVLFARLSRFQGVDGINAFIKNAEFLGYQRTH